MARTEAPAARGRIARALLLAVSLVGGLALAAGFFGAVVPFFDSLAHFRAHFAVLLLATGVALMMAGPVLAGFLAAIFGGLGFVTVAANMLPAPAPQASEQAASYTLLQMNLRWDTQDRAAAIRLVGRLQPDVVALEEAGDGWQPLLAALEGSYPYRFDCGAADRFGKLALLSRRAFARGDAGLCDADDGFLSRAVNFNGRPVTIVVQHLRWPWPGRQWQQVERLEDRLAALSAPTLIAGDFNAAPWSALLERYATLSGTRIVPHVGPTWLPQPLTGWLAAHAGLPIDNLLVGDGIEIVDVTRPGATGSDHLPVLLTFAVPAPAPVVPAMDTAGQRAIIR